MITPYSHDVHYERLCRWLRVWGITPWKKEELPMVGFCVDGIVIAFLVRTDCKLAYMDNCVSDPMSFKKDRDEAVKKLIAKLEESARSEGFTTIGALADRNAMKNRLSDCQYQKHGDYAFYVKAL